MNVKRKNIGNIDLPVEIFQKLSVLEAAAGKSLKAYIESVLTKEADSMEINIRESPSPGGDPWFDDLRNRSAGTAERKYCHDSCIDKTIWR